MTQNTSSSGPEEALNQLGTRMALGSVARAMEFPDTFDEAGQESEGEDSMGLTLLPTAVYSEDEGDETQEESQFGQFSEARVVNDPYTGQVVLERHAVLGEEDRMDAEDQGKAIARIIGNRQTRMELDNRIRLADKSMAVFSASERYNAYQTVLERQAQEDEREDRMHKKQKIHQDEADSGGFTEQPPNAPPKVPPPVLVDILSSKHALPPETGDFVTSRTASGRTLYFAVRSEIDTEKRLNRITGGLRDRQGHMGSAQINRVVADIESELDTEAALAVSRMELDETQDTSSAVAGEEGALWVDKYRAQSFLDLVSDERTNRAVMQWLKEWDYCVFGHARAVAADGERAVDRWRRPQRRILLLSGPPGLGKTTLAHVAARQAGYSVVEINASDDRTVSKVRDRVLGVTRTQALGAGGRPQLLIIDEIDGVSGAQTTGGDFVSMLVRLADDHQPGGNKRNRDGGPLLRPIICICNNAYAPTLRPLRQVALSFHVHPPPSVRLARRLEDVCQLEGVAADAWALVELAKQNDGDMRACLNALQLLSAYREPRISLDRARGAACKDVHRSLFAIWGLVFGTPDASSLKTTGGVAQDVHRRHAALCVDAVRSSGEHERLMQGCFENYLRMEFRDLTHTKVAALCTDWLGFHDSVDLACKRNPAGAAQLHGYLDYTPLAVHRTCRSPVGLSRGDFEYPHSEYEAFQKRQAAASTLNALVGGCLSVRTRSTLSTANMASLGFVDYLLHILSPQLTTSNKHLLKGPEKVRFDRMVEIMGAWQLAFVQFKDADGQFVYRVDPPIDRLFGFAGRRPALKVMAIRYPVRQLVAQELDRVRIARAAAKQEDFQVHPHDVKDLAKREYLAKLFSDPMPSFSGSKGREPEAAGVLVQPEPGVVKDFFGRIVTQKPAKQPSTSDTLQPTTSEQLDGPPPRAWFRFFEGFSNAVRKPTVLKELL
ncbi:Chromosome transmission fidelity protein 18 [Coemansia sp. RSA 1933]|nr:Chromosome transmission fidelity protein 18 [Coemansia sp. RSA 1933]